MTYKTGDKQTMCVCVCVCVSSELFVKIVLLLQIDGCWCRLHWPSLAGSDLLPGSGLLICWPTWPCLVDWLWPALHCTASTCLWHGLFLKEPWTYCCFVLSPFHFIYTKFCLKNFFNCQYYTNGIFNSHNIIWICSWTLQTKIKI